MLLNQTKKVINMQTAQIVNIMMDFADEPSNNVPANATLPQIAMAMMAVQEWLLPIQKEALQRYLINKSN